MRFQQLDTTDPFRGRLVARIDYFIPMNADSCQFWFTGSPSKSPKETKVQKIDASIAVSVSELKKSPATVIDNAEGGAVTVLNHNRVMAYLVPADTYGAMLDRLDDLDLLEIARTCANEQPASVSIHEL